MVRYLNIYIYIFLLFSCTVAVEITPSGNIDLFGLEGEYFNGQASRDGYFSGLFLSSDAAFFYENEGYEWSVKEEGKQKELSSINYQSDKIQLISSEILPLSRSLIIGEKVQSGSYDVVLSIYSQGKVNDEDFLLRRFERKVFINN